MSARRKAAAFRFEVAASSKSDAEIGKEVGLSVRRVNELIRVGSQPKAIKRLMETKRRAAEGGADRPAIEERDVQKALSLPLSERITLLTTAKAEDLAAVGLVDTANDYIEKIRCAWSKSAEAIIETGRLLNEAKANLFEGTFLVMVGEKLPFSRSWAFKLMKIANDPRLNDVSHAKQLPPRAETLYLLTTLNDDEWKTANRRGLIRQDVARREIVAIRKPKVRPAHVPPAPTAPRVVVDADPGDHEDEAIPDDAHREDEQHEVARPKRRMLPGKPLLERLTRSKDALDSAIYALEGIEPEIVTPNPAFAAIRDDLLNIADRIVKFARRIEGRAQHVDSVATREKHECSAVRTFDPGTKEEDVRRWIEGLALQIPEGFAEWIRQENLTPEEREAEKKERIREGVARILGGRKPAKRRKGGQP